jgi:hypothetical protein
MRTIEEKMLAAIRASKSARLGNTVVEAIPGTGAWRVFLHGNLIANGGRVGMSFTLASWGTPTTRSRVNALLAVFARGNARVFQRAHGQMFQQGGEARAIGTSEWVTPACLFVDNAAAA